MTTTPTPYRLAPEILEDVIVHEGTVVRNTLLGESPYVALEGTTTRTSENTEGRKSQSSGTIHGRFLLDEEMLGKHVRITIEIVK